MNKFLQYFLIFLTFCNQSNKFNRLELMSLMELVPKEYYITNKYSKFSYNFNRPQVIHITSEDLTSAKAEEISSSKFGVFIHYEYENDEGVFDETLRNHKYSESCAVNNYGNMEQADLEFIRKLFGGLFESS